MITLFKTPKKAIVSLYRKATAVYWQVAVVEHAFPILLSKKADALIFQYNENNWFADPFIFDVRENEIDIIAEEYLTDKRKGIISLLTISKLSKEVITKKKILELETHLSFPFIFRENGKTYMFPENSASGTHSVYEIKKDFKTEKIGEVVSEPLTDTAIVKIEDSYYLFGTRLPEENGNTVRVYISDELIGKYTLHQEIRVNDSTARGASGVYQLEKDRIYYRLSQDNAGFYGRGLVYQEITFDSKTKLFSINEKYRRYPSFDDKGYVAMHTYNSMAEFAVVDLKKYKHPFWGKFVNYLRYHRL